MLFLTRIMSKLGVETRLNNGNAQEKPTDIKDKRSNLVSLFFLLIVVLFLFARKG